MNTSSTATKLITQAPSTAPFTAISVSPSMAPSRRVMLKLRNRTLNRFKALNLQKHTASKAISKSKHSQKIGQVIGGYTFSCADMRTELKFINLRSGKRMLIVSPNLSIVRHKKSSRTAERFLGCRKLKTFQSLRPLNQELRKNAKTSSPIKLQNKQEGVRLRNECTFVGTSPIQLRCRSNAQKICRSPTQAINRNMGITA
eukprot:403350906